MNSQSGTKSEGGKIELFSLIIYKCMKENKIGIEGVSNKAILLSVNTHLSSFPFFYRSTVRQHILFHSRLVASRTKIGSCQKVEFEQKLGFCYCFVNSSGLAACCLSSVDYPPRVAIGLVNVAVKRFHEVQQQQRHIFLSVIYENRWESIGEDVPEGTMFQKEGQELLATYQNPVEADKLLKVQQGLADVREVMVKNVKSLLERGEKLDDLMKKSEELSDTSYQFYRQAKKNNQCCTWY